MDIHIKWDSDKNDIHLPINPESFFLSNNMNNESVIVHNLGEINLKGKRGLYSITLESFFPSQSYDFARTTYEDPSTYITKLKTLFEENTTVHLIITETEINGFFTIENFEFGNEERNLDVKYVLTLKEFREIASSSAGSGSSGSNRSGKTPKSSTHKWKKGDTWQKVTKKYLGNSKTWKTQKKNNKSVINKAKKKNPKKKENVALIGYKVVIKA